MVKKHKKNNASEKNQILQLTEVYKELTSILTARSKWAGGDKGLMFGGARDLYRNFGYKHNLSYKDYYNVYARTSIGSALIEKIPTACWSKIPNIVDDSEEGVTTEFEDKILKIIKEVDFWDTCLRLDKILGLGPYAVLLLGIDDKALLSEPVIPDKNLKLNYCQVYSVENAKILTTNKDPSSKRFNLPEMYQLQTGFTDTWDGFNVGLSVDQQTFQVHHTRIIHVAENCLDNILIGKPRLMSVFNDLQNLEKVVGGAAEMFWLAGMSALAATTKDGYNLSNSLKEDLQNQFNEFQQNIRRILTVEGVDLNVLKNNVVSPKDTVSTLMDMICIAFGIPKRIFIGSERGELASSQDQATWNKLIEDRRTMFCIPKIINKFIAKLLELEILPEPTTGDYNIDYPNDSMISPKEKAEILRKTTDAITKYASTTDVERILPHEFFLRNILGYDQKTTDKILELTNNLFKKTKGDEIPENNNKEYN